MTLAKRAAWSAAVRMGLQVYDPSPENLLALDELTEYVDDPRPIGDKRPTTATDDLPDLTLVPDALGRVVDVERFRGARVLEVGPKYGVHARWIDRELRPSELVFSDFESDTHLHEKWVGSLARPHRFVYGDLRDADELLELEPFDLVFFLGVLYHSIHHLPLLGMLNRVTKPGGTMLLRDLDRPAARRARAPPLAREREGEGRADDPGGAARARVDGLAEGRRASRTTGRGRPRRSSCARRRTSSRDGADLADVVTPHRPGSVRRMPDLRLVPKAELDRIRGRATSPRTIGSRSSPTSCRLNALVAVKRAGSGHLGSTLQRDGRRRVPPLRGAEHGSVGWDSTRSRRVLLLEGARRAGPLRGAVRARRDPARAAPEAAPSRRARRPPGRRRPGDRGQLRLARHGHLEGTRHRVGEAPSRPRRPRRRHGRRRRAAGGPELRGAPGGRARAPRRASRSSSIATSSSRTSRPTRSCRSASSRRGSARSAGTSRPATGTTSAQLRDAFASFREIGDRPQALVARTIKGKGVSFMEHPAALREGGGTYRWHAGAPDDESFERAFAELVGAHRRAARGARASSALELEPVAADVDAASRGRSRASPSPAPERAARRSRTSTSSRPTARSSSGSEPNATTSSSSTPTSPPTAACARSSSRIRTGSSSAGSPSRTWSRPPPASRGTACCPSSTRSRPSSRRARTSRSTTRRASGRRSSTRSTTQGSSRPGRGSRTSRCATSRSSPRCRDMTIVQPASAEETRALLRWAVEEAEENVAIRLAIGPSPRRIELRRAALAGGRGRVVRDGSRRDPPRLRAGDAARGAHRVRAPRRARRRPRAS